MRDEYKKFIPSFIQLDDNISVVRMATQLSNGYQPTVDDAEIVWDAIGYSIGVFFILLYEEK